MFQGGRGGALQTPSIDRKVASGRQAPAWPRSHRGSASGPAAMASGRNVSDLKLLARAPPARDLGGFASLSGVRPMKRIIHGKRYDTKTAELVHDWDNGRNP